MSYSLAMIMDPVESIKPYKDSSFAMLLAAQQKGWHCVYFTSENLSIVNNQASGKGQRIKVKDTASDYYSLSAEKTYHLGEFDFILMRKDPPFDMNYIYSTYILELAKQQGAIVVNDPQSLRNYNEKVTITLFPQCAPECLVSGDTEIIRDFIKQHRDVILKPLDGMGGQSIFRVSPQDKNLSVILELMLQDPASKIMAQVYIPEISQGDKRILMINGKAADFALARIPAKGETRGNIAAGGQGIAQPLTARDYWISEQLSDFLKRNGIIFAGIDVIGDYLTEINITSPTCIREIDQQKGTHIALDLINELETIHANR